jgi:hypothetical protein
LKLDFEPFVIFASFCLLFLAALLRIGSTITAVILSYQLQRHGVIGFVSGLLSPGFAATNDLHNF